MVIKMMINVVKVKLLILSLYYLGDPLVQINSFSWRGFGAAVRLLC